MVLRHFNTPVKSPFDGLEHQRICWLSTNTGRLLHAHVHFRPGRLLLFLSLSEQHRWKNDRGVYDVWLWSIVRRSSSLEPCMNDVSSDGGKQGWPNSHQRKGGCVNLGLTRMRGPKIPKLKLTSFVKHPFPHGRSPPPLLRFGPPLI